MSPQLQHTFAAVLLEISYLAAGLMLCWFGKEMLEKGLTSAFRADGSIAGTKWRVATSSPGLVFMLAGLIVIGMAIRQQAQYEEGPAKPDPASKATVTSTEPPGREPQTQVASRLVEPRVEQIMLSRLGMFAQDRAGDADVSGLLRQIPRAPDLESVAQTAERLREVLERNPGALYRLLRQPESGWILESRTLTLELLSGIERLEAAK